MTNMYVRVMEGNLEKTVKLRTKSVTTEMYKALVSVCSKAMPYTTLSLLGALLNARAGFFPHTHARIIKRVGEDDGSEAYKVLRSNCLRTLITGSLTRLRKQGLVASGGVGRYTPQGEVVHKQILQPDLPMDGEASEQGKLLESYLVTLAEQIRGFGIATLTASVTATELTLTMKLPEGRKIDDTES